MRSNNTNRRYTMNILIHPDGSAELYHHGVKGQKWGIRRYQNEDGTLTELGRKRQLAETASDKKATIVKGSTLYRVTTSDKTEANGEKIYVTAEENTRDHYINALGLAKIYNEGKAYMHEYTAKTDIKMPDRKTMEKVELSLLKDPKVREEIIDSIMAKGVSRERATELTQEYNAGKAALDKMKNISAGAAFVGAYGFVLTSGTMNPGAMAVGTAAGAVIGGAAKAKSETAERRRVLNTVRASYGDVNNKVTNEMLRTKLSDMGYNAVKDYNDRRAYGKNGKQAIIIFDSNKNIANTKITELNSKNYAEVYARSYLKNHPKSKLTYNDLLKDGAKLYKQYYDDGVVARAAKETRKEILEANKAEKNRRTLHI